MLREKNLLAHTEHSSMEFLRADSVPNQHAHVPRASVAKIHGNTCLWALTLMKRNQNLVETQKAATRARRLAVVSCPTQTARITVCRASLQSLLGGCVQ